MLSGSASDFDLGMCTDEFHFRKLYCFGSAYNPVSVSCSAESTILHSVDLALAERIGLD